MKIKNQGNRETNQPMAEKPTETRPTQKQPDNFECKHATVLEDADLSPHVKGGWQLTSTVRSVKPDHVTHYFKRRKS